MTEVQPLDEEKWINDGSSGSSGFVFIFGLDHSSVSDFSKNKQVATERPFKTLLFLPHQADHYYLGSHY